MEGGEPVKPYESDCCGSGCTPCVFDIYEQQMELWQNNQLPSTPAHIRADLLSDSHFKPFRLINKSQLTEDVCTFSFQPVIEIFNDQEQNITGVLPYSIGQHFILRCFMQKVDDKNNEHEDIEFINISEFLNVDGLVPKSVKMLTRAYTPITIAFQEKNCIFQVFAKLYDKGKVSHYLRKSLVGDIFYWRGPYGQFKYEPNLYSHILIVCIGSGLAPMIAIVKSVLFNESDETVIHMMYGVKNINHVILRKDLNGMTQFWNFTLEYYFSEEIEPNCNLRFGEYSQNKHIDRTALSEYILGKNMRNLLVLLCGTERFVNDMRQLISDVKLECSSNIISF